MRKCAASKELLGHFKGSRQLVSREWRGFAECSACKNPPFPGVSSKDTEPELASSSSLMLFSGLLLPSVYFTLGVMNSKKFTRPNYLAMILDIFFPLLELGQVPALVGLDCQAGLVILMTGG